jgi:hypothetical protein
VSERRGGGAEAAMRQVGAVAWADLLERMRRYSFLVTLAGTLYFGYLVNAGYVQLIIHGLRGVYNSAWVGTLIAVSVGTFLSLIGFFLVKNTLDHDRRSGVGEILAATPLSNLAYLLGKAISNFLLLGAILALLALAAAVSQLLKGEDTRVDVVALLAPIVFLTLPALALAAATAVLFEAVPGLRSTFGNVVYFAFWISLVTLSVGSSGNGSDLIGLRLVESSFIRALPAATAPRGDMSLSLGPPERRAAAPATGAEPATGAGPSPASHSGGVRWDGIRWTAGLVARRLAWVGIALVEVVLGSLLFARFDAARERRRGRRKGALRAGGAIPDGASGAPPDGEAPDYVASLDGAVRVTAPTAAVAMTANAASRTAAGAPAPPRRRLAGARWAPRSRAFSLVLAEMRLMLRGRSFWWFAVAAGLAIGGLFAPAGTGRAMILAVAWIWPLPLWSELGARESLHGVRPLLLAAPLPPVPRAAAIWVAGATVAALSGAGVAVRLAVEGDARALLAWAVGCLFIPALALGLGSLSGSPRLFEVVYLLLWYIGPMNSVATLDFTGMSAAARAAGYMWIYLALSGLLFAAAAAVTSRQTDR